VSIHKIAARGVAIFAGASAAIALAGAGLVPAEAAGPIPVPCSVTALATAINTAPNGSLLVLAPYCTYPLTSRLTITNNLSLLGSSTTISRSTSATNPFSLLSVQGNVSITNVNFRGGSGVIGGAISNSGALSISGGLFSGNTASLYGGAIGNMGTLAISGAVFTGNTANSVGGAILDLMTATLLNCRFTGNSTPGDGGAIASEMPKDGPIQSGKKTPATADGPLAPPMAHLTVSNSSFTANNSQDGGAIDAAGFLTLSGDGFTGNGSPTTYMGGAVTLEVGTMTMTHSTLSGNQAGNGGAVFDNETATFISDNITGNTANTALNGNGGGIYYDGQITVTNSKISSNNAVDDGGGIFAEGPATISGTQIFKNQAAYMGGGIYNRGSAITLSHSPVYSNTPDNCSPAGSTPGCIG